MHAKPKMDSIGSVHTSNGWPEFYIYICVCLRVMYIFDLDSTTRTNFIKTI